FPYEAARPWSCPWSWRATPAGAGPQRKIEAGAKGSGRKPPQGPTFERSGGGRALGDSFRRAITYLRASGGARRDLRCVYCMSEHMTSLPKSDLLTLEELDRLCSAFVARGVRKLRLTGGEPLVRRGIMTLFASLSRHLATGALEELTLTTNGSQLPKYARE